MTGRHWVDELFRERMERRAFPVEEGEFEEVRALIRDRNSATSRLRERGISKWWFLTLLPAAVLLWRASVDQAVVVDSRIQTRAGTTLTAEGPGPGSQEFSRNGAKGQAGLMDTVSDEVWRPTVTAASQAGPDGRLEDNRADAQVWGAQRVPRSLLEEGPSEQASGAIGGAAGQGTGLGFHDGSPVDQAGIKGPAWPDLIGGSAPPVALGGADAVRFMEPRWPAPPVADRPVLLWVGMPEIRRSPSGELYFFGARLAARAKSGDGQRYSVQDGSLVGMEYRVRAKRFSWATGVYYGTYGIGADRDAANVTLNFVEVPLLASYGVNYGRFGLMLQGGVSVDLLFSSSGRYTPGEAGTGTGFPDDAFRRANCSWLLRPQVLYHLGGHLTVGAGPLWKAQLGKVANMGALEDARIGSSGVGFGLTWRLDHATF